MTIDYSMKTQGFEFKIGKRWGWDIRVSYNTLLDGKMTNRTLCKGKGHLQPTCRNIVKIKTKIWPLEPGICHKPRNQTYYKTGPDKVK